MDKDYKRLNMDVNERERMRLAYQAAVAAGKLDGDVLQHEGNDYILAYMRHLLTYLDDKLPAAKTWISPPPGVCDITGQVITDEFYDSRLATGTAWAIMCPNAWIEFGPKICGTGHGQHYKKRPDGRFVKIEG